MFRQIVILNIMLLIGQKQYSLIKKILLFLINMEKELFSCIFSAEV